MLHAALLVMTYQLYDGTNPFVWPGPRSLTGNYLVTRLEPEKPPEPPKPTPRRQGQQQDRGAPRARDRRTSRPRPRATRARPAARATTERARDPNANDDKAGAARRSRCSRTRTSKVLDNIIDRHLSTTSASSPASRATSDQKGGLGFGTGTGTGVGDGIGTGHHARQQGQGPRRRRQRRGRLRQTKARARSTPARTARGGTCVGPNCTGAAPKAGRRSSSKTRPGDFAGLTEEEINRVVKARAGVFRACYQKELNRSPGIGGKLVVHFVIGGDGSVKNAGHAAAARFATKAVESCVKRQHHAPQVPRQGRSRTSTIRSCSPREASHAQATASACSAARRVRERPVVRRPDVRPDADAALEAA